MTVPPDLPFDGEGPEDAQLLRQLAEAFAPEAVEPSAARIAQVRALAEHVDSPPLALPSGGRRRGRRDLLLGGAAAGLGLVFGAVGGRATAPEEEATGPPTEPVVLEGVPVGVEATARLINHTWGVELLLDVAHLVPGATYDISYTSVTGEQVAAGSFVAVPDVTMVCRFNGALLRSQTAALEVRGREDDVLMSARLV